MWPVSGHSIFMIKLVDYKRITNALLFVLFWLLLNGCESDRSFRFALLSDLHIAKGSPAAGDLRSVVQDINTLKEIDFVLVAGDVTEMDVDGNLDTAKVILDKLRNPYYIIPGNHDTKWTDSGAQRFGQLFSDDRFVFDYQGYRFVGLHQGPLIRMGDGLIAPQDLEWLDSLVTTTEIQKPLIWVTHYPVDESISNVNAFLGRMHALNSVLIMHGHGHRNRISAYGGIPAIMTRSTLKAGQPAAGYNIVTIARDTAIVRERLVTGSTGPAWARIPLVRNTENTFYDLEQTSSPPHVQEKWRVETGYSITATAVTDSNFVFMGDASGKMRALDLQSGTMIWERAREGPVYATASVDSEMVVFASTDGTLRSFIPETGDPIWVTNLGDPIISVLLLDQDQVFVGSSNKGFYALDKQLGNVQWHVPQAQGYIETRPLLIDELLVFGTWKNKLYALDRYSGGIRWVWQDGTPGPLYSPAACWPVAGDGKIFIVAPDRYATAIDKESGKTVWRSNRFMVRESIGISGDRTRVFVKTMRDTVVAFAATADQLTPLWISDCGYGYEHAPSMLLEKNGSLYFGTRKGEVYCLDAMNGQVRWKFRIDKSLVNTVTPVSANSVLATTLSGSIVYLSTKP
jgi:outer membrane protein assembly factor BamB